MSRRGRRATRGDDSASTRIAEHIANTWTWMRCSRMRRGVEHLRGTFTVLNSGTI